MPQEGGCLVVWINEDPPFKQNDGSKGCLSLLESFGFVTSAIDLACLKEKVRRCVRYREVCARVCLRCDARYGVKLNSDQMSRSMYEFIEVNIRPNTRYYTLSGPLSLFISAPLTNSHLVDMN
jgi:hypothetical protein